MIEAAAVITVLNAYPDDADAAVRVFACCTAMHNLSPVLLSMCCCVYFCVLLASFLKVVVVYYMAACQ